jgi:ribosomal protein S18 acetylase RimI-like enzyme
MNTTTTTINKDLQQPEIELVVPLPADFASLMQMKALAFAEKRQGNKNDDGTKTYGYYQQHHPAKVQHCRIVRDSAGGAVIGAVQVQIQGDPPDLALPSVLRHTLVKGQAYVEFIACHPDHTGKGIGSKLLQWAKECAIENGAAVLALEVMKKNRAVRLYERKGFVVCKSPDVSDECDAFFQGLLVYLCLGCSYWTVVYMEKDLRVD